jgi:hypothetical protein
MTLILNTSQIHIDWLPGYSQFPISGLTACAEFLATLGSSGQPTMLHSGFCISAEYKADIRTSKVNPCESKLGRLQCKGGKLEVQIRKYASPNPEPQAVWPIHQGTTESHGRLNRHAILACLKATLLLLSEQHSQIGVYVSSPVCRYVCMYVCMCVCVYFNSKYISDTYIMASRVHSETHIRANRLC